MRNKPRYGGKFIFLHFVALLRLEYNETVHPTIFENRDDPSYLVFIIF